MARGRTPSQSIPDITTNSSWSAVSDRLAIGWRIPVSSLSRSSAQSAVESLHPAAPSSARSNSREVLGGLKATAPVILPSLLLCDFGNLEREIGRLHEAGVKGLHLDVMDGVFVPNFTYGLTIVQAIRGLTDLPLDVHLMMVEPQRYLEAFRGAGADLITVHVEAAPTAEPVLQEIRRLGAGVGLALNPGTPVEAILPFLDLVDLVLVMSVNAGFGGQAFDTTALEKLKRIREQARSEVLLEVDGGINRSTIGLCAEAGADLFVVGSAIFRTSAYGPAVSDLAAIAKTHFK